jgi:hypothetical protein
MPKWRNEYRRCDNCRREYRLQREAQSYCSRDCRRQAAYGRERFKNGTKGPRRRRLEASETLRATVVAGSFRNMDFSSLKQDHTERQIGSRNSQAVANEIDQAYWTREKRKWPVDLIGGNRHHTKKPTILIDLKLRHAIVDTERLLEEDLATPVGSSTDRGLLGLCRLNSYFRF